jgi:2-polyprenyl-3-methyl-5-hydroxy-6-metoxy-1,4-benzoquinol methylase
MTKCLLCNSTDTKILSSVATKKIVQLYLEYFKSDFSYLFSDGEIKLMKCTSCGLMFYIPQVSGDEHFYAVLQKTNNYYRGNKEEYVFAAKNIKDGADVLDVGCGKGEFKKFIQNCNFTGLEFSPDAIKAGTKDGCLILDQSIEDHAKHYPRKYDVVTAFQVLEHVTNVQSFIKSCADCVKPGGKLIIAVPSEESYLQYSTNSILNMPPHHITRWTDTALSNIADIIDFKLDVIYHDNLDNLHVESFFTHLVERSLPLKRLNRKLIYTSITFKVRLKIASLISKRIAKRCSNPAWFGKGQNVTAIYLKGGA